MDDIVSASRDGYKKILKMRWLAWSLLMLAYNPSLTWATGIIADRSVRMPIRGVVRPNAEAIISTDLTTIITRIGFKEGERFTKGSLLITLDCRRLNAELASAEAYHKEMKITLKSAVFLNSRNASSRQDLETAQARSDRSLSDVNVFRAQVDKCKIIAPFDGRVAELSAHEHEMSVAGKPLFSIVAERDPKIELIVPSKWLTWLKTDARFEFHIDETETKYIGKVTRLGAVVDTVSQTIKIFGTFVSPMPNILPGMSGTAKFDPSGRG